MIPLLDRSVFDDYRQARTNEYLQSEAVSAHYRTRRIHVVVGPKAGDTYAGQLLTLCTVNMLLRLFRNTTVSVGDQALHQNLRRGSQHFLADRLQAEAWGADPFSQVMSSERNPEYILHVGEEVDGAPAPDLVIGSRGWIARASRARCAGIEPDPYTNPCGPALAASIAVSEALKAALGFRDDLRVSETAISTFDYSVGNDVREEQFVPERLDVGNTLMVGAGSVGSNLAYLLDTISASGALKIVDHDVVKGVNLDRSLLFCVTNLGWPKAEVVARWVSNGIRTQALGITYNEYVRQHGRQPNGLDLVLPLANEEQVRWAIANSIPPLTIHGTTRGDWGANLGRHIPLLEPCLGCRFGREAEPEYVCAVGSVETGADATGTQNDASLPFLSAAAATFALAEILKTKISGYPHNEQFVDLDFKGSLRSLAHHTRTRSSACACTSLTSETFERFNGETRFAQLSDSLSISQAQIKSLSSQ